MRGCARTVSIRKFGGKHASRLRGIWGPLSFCLSLRQLRIARRASRPNIQFFRAQDLSLRLLARQHRIPVDRSYASARSSGAVRVADKLCSSTCGSLVVEAGRRARLILSVSALTVLTSACANAPPEVASWQFTTVSFDRTDPPPAPYGEKPSSGWRTIVPDPVATRQSASAAGWSTEVIPYETEWP